MSRLRANLPAGQAGLRLLDEVDRLRSRASGEIDPEQKCRMGQYFTPAPVARLMASMFSFRADIIRLLDPGAGVGNLVAACVELLCKRRQRPKRIEVCAYELDSALCRFLSETMRLAHIACKDAGIEFYADVRQEDFLESAVVHAGNLFSPKNSTFNAIIMNPPYYKIRTSSRERKLIEMLGVETSNVYAGFVVAAIRLLEQGGELVAITPRSFCNGVYFKSFRRFLLNELSLRRIHVFGSRNRVFRSDGVLQENLILHAEKTRQSTTVEFSTSIGPEDNETFRRIEQFDRVVLHGDPNYVIHVVPDRETERIRQQYSRFCCSLDDLGVDVSTGRVVDFRVRSFLRKNGGKNGTAPLIYPMHMRDGFVTWPRDSKKKPNAIKVCDKTKRLLVPNAFYVLVKRFSAKEERRRITAAVYDPTRIDCTVVGFENHLNFFHDSGEGLEEKLAKGLAVFLNSTVVDAYFRQFSGHTQVNATDLRNMRYPSREALKKLGAYISRRFPKQEEIDRLIETI